MKAAITGGFVWRLNGVRRVPYRLPELSESELEMVSLVERERDADSLAVPAFYIY